MTDIRHLAWIPAGAVPTLLSANRVASPISHVAMHVAAVIQTPETDLYLPPHRTANPTHRRGAAGRRGIAS